VLEHIHSALVDSLWQIAGLVEPYRSLSQESLSWIPRNPLEMGSLPLPLSSSNQQVNLFWSLLLMRIASTIQVGLMS